MYKISELNWRTGTLTKVDPVPAARTKRRAGRRRKVVAPMVKVVLVEVVAFVLVLLVHIKCAYTPPVLYFDQEKFEAKMKEKFIRAVLDKANSQASLDTLAVPTLNGNAYDELQAGRRYPGLNCRGVGVPDAPWVNYLVLAPPAAGLSSFKRLLRSIESDKDATGMCGVRVCIAFGGGSDENEVTEASRSWSRGSGIEVFFVPTYSDDTQERLHESVVWLAQFWKRDVLFVVDPAVVVPQGFSGIVRSSTRSGGAVFMPRFLESGTRNWNRVGPEALENVGMYVSDAMRIGLYSEPTKTPLTVCIRNRMKINAPKIYGLVKDE